MNDALLLIGEKCLISYWEGSRDQIISNGFMGGNSLLVAYWVEETD